MEKADLEEQELKLQAGSGRERSSPYVSQNDILGETEINDRYELRRQLGIGGSGTVFEAFDKLLQKNVALKLLHLDASSMVANRRFNREAQAGTALAHPNIVCMRESNIDAAGRQFIVMDLIDGRPLSNILEEKTTLSQDRIVNLALQIASGLLHAHQHGVLHRDIKPSNVMVQKDGTAGEIAMVADFGIARMIDVETGRLTLTGETVGTPYYMSPEQALGNPTDERSDIYSFGCMLFEILEGQPPFIGDNHLAVMTQHLVKEPPAVRREDSSPALNSLINTCLQKEPKNRPQSFGAVIERLNDIRDGKQPAASRKGSTLRILSITTCSILGVLCLISMIACCLVPQAFKPEPKISNLDLAPAKTQPATELDWDTLDLRGQQFCNHQEYALARKDFQAALQLQNKTKQQTLLTLEKLALLCHLTGERAKEKTFDQDIRNLRSGPTPGSNADVLKKALLLVPDNAKLTRSAELESLGSDVLAEARRLLAERNTPAAAQLLAAALPRLNHLLGADALVCIKLRGLRAELLMSEDKIEESLVSTEDSVDKLAGKVRDDDYDLNENLLRASKLRNLLQNPAKAEVFAERVKHNLGKLPVGDARSRLALRADIELARAMYLQYETEKSLEKYQECLKQANLAKDLEIVELAAAGISNIYRRSNDFGAAKKMFSQLLETSTDPVQRSVYLLLYGDLHFRQPYSPQLYNEGLDLFRKSLEIRQHLLSPQSYQVKEALKYVITGEITASRMALKVSPELEGLAREYVAINERVPFCPADDRASSLTTLGYLLHLTGDVAGAKSCIDRSIAIAKKNHHVTEAFNWWFYTAAARIYPQSLVTLQSVFESRLNGNHEPPDSIGYAQFLDDIAHVCAVRQDTKSAIDFLKRAIVIVLKHTPSSLSQEDRWNAGTILKNYSSALRDSGDIKESGKYGELANRYCYPKD